VLQFACAKQRFLSKFFEGCPFDLSPVTFIHQALLRRVPGNIPDLLIQGRMFHTFAGTPVNTAVINGWLVGFGSKVAPRRVTPTPRW